MNNIKPHITIIIPTFNRAALLHETLDSIQKQSYQNWECLLIDDGSTENNIEIITQYLAKDPRFRLFQRSDYKKPKGANACRNIGLEKAQGKYITFFDSDDLMTIDHLSLKLQLITSGDYDFAVARTEYFNNPKNINPINYRNLGKVEITATSYITKQINWLTLDIIIRSEIAKLLVFNELLMANQEYNFFCKLTLISQKAIQTDAVITKRRFDSDSIQGSLAKNPQLYLVKAFYGFWLTYIDLLNFQNFDKQSRTFLINQCITLLYKNKGSNGLEYNKHLFLKALFREKGIKMLKYLSLLK